MSTSAHKQKTGAKKTARPQVRILPGTYDLLRRLSGSMKIPMTYVMDRAVRAFVAGEGASE